MNKKVQVGQNKEKRKGIDKMEDILRELNQLLCDLNVFYRKLQNYHWNIKGKDFFVIHAKLEEYYNQINEQIDEVAEHVLALDGEPFGRLEDYLEKTKLVEAQNQKVNCTVVFENVTKDFNILLQEVKLIKKLADSESEFKTGALMDTMIESYTKILWMLKQTME